MPDGYGRPSGMWAKSTGSAVPTRVQKMDTRTSHATASGICGSKAAVGLVEMLFPEHRFEADEVFVIAIELRRDGLDAPALRRHIDR